ncbi:hypothetical protein EIN_240240 [Entamoeba invadens IP1]|uniref:Uncharacterized protein n=1 Tax=Entamoeba invadens IP1 TaxID=370355 RepID=L7FNJ4_ENTIV|nr:hypothetical protein EIN_240240 [Entamoeba invadens IP1]ELP94491.1 hypothetical protein EIN_240240 [Entamoeba invadens IP1]|eukprot:XP_004261262.1 hypothetical protein EIN_240240 [Entamoeba invadens IP1]
MDPKDVLNEIKEDAKNTANQAVSNVIDKGVDGIVNEGGNLIQMAGEKMGLGEAISKQIKEKATSIAKDKVEEVGITLKETAKNVINGDFDKAKNVIENRVKNEINNVKKNINELKNTDFKNIGGNVVNKAVNYGEEKLREVVNNNQMINNLGKTVGLDTNTVNKISGAANTFLNNKISQVANSVENNIHKTLGTTNLGENNKNRIIKNVNFKQLGQEIAQNKINQVIKNVKKGINKIPITIRH